MGMLYALRRLGEIPLTAKSVGISLAFTAVVRPVYARTPVDLWNPTLYIPASLSLVNLPRELFYTALHKPLWTDFSENQPLRAESPCRVSATRAGTATHDEATRHQHLWCALFLCFQLLDQ